METTASRARPKSPGLAGKKGLIIGIANEHSIAFGCAPTIRAQDGALSTTYLNEKARPCVEPLVTQLAVQSAARRDVEQIGQREARYSEPNRHRGQLDFVLHAARISTACSRVWAWIISTNAELMLAQQARAVLAPGSGE